MKAVGVICECNPFHEGHRYLIRQAKAAGADAVIALMSGHFTQRGDAAVADAVTRAETVLAGGADAVLELPFPDSSASAEHFAAAGVNILSRLGVRKLWFGSECGDGNAILRAADAVRTPEFRARYEETVRESTGTAAAFASVLQKLCGADTPFSPNDLLGIAYCRAIAEHSLPLLPVPVRRIGAGYRETDLQDGEFPSAGALRRILETDGRDAFFSRLLPETRAALEKADGHTFPADLRHAGSAILGQFRLNPPDAWDDVPELTGGLGRRIASCAQTARSLDELYALAATKKYPDARIRRGILFAMTGVLRSDLQTPPAYVRLLAANGKGRAFLAASRKNGAIAVVTKHADLPKTPDALRQNELANRAAALFTLCLSSPIPAADLVNRAPVIAD